MGQDSIYKTPGGEHAVREFYDSVLAHWPVPVEGVQVETRQGPTSILACGPPHGPPLVLLHGASSNALMWMADVAHLAQRHRLYAIDIIGEPGRSAPTRPRWAGPAYSDWLADTLDGLGLGSVKLLGLSQGGWIALKLATAQPERIEKLVLLSPAGVVRDRATFLLRVLPLLLLGKRGIRAINRIVVGPQPMDPGALAFMELILTHVRSRMDASPLFTDLELQRLTMPVLLLGGEKDAIRDCRAIEKRLRGLLPRFEAQLLPETGHALVKVAPRVAPFLNR